MKDIMDMNNESATRNIKAEVETWKKSKTIKIENKGHFKLYLLCIEVLAIVVSIVSSFWLCSSLKSKVRYEAEYIDKTSFYSDSGFDLLVSGASKQQIEEYRQKEFVQKVASVSKISLYVKTGSVEDYRDLLVFDSLEDLESSEFTEKRLIEKNESSNPIYADYKFCDLYNVKLGDDIAVSVNGEKKNYHISRVYRTDYFHSEGVLITTKDVLTFSSKSQLMYITTENKNKLIEDLKDYKPLGTLLDKKETQTDEEYQKYLNEFNSKKYFDSYVTDNTNDASKLELNYSSKISTSKKNFYIAVVVISVICLLFSFVCFFVNAKNKKDKIFKYIQENGDTKLLVMFSIFDLSFIIFMIIGAILAVYLSLSSLTVYYTLGSALASSHLCIWLPTIGILISYLITMIVIKKA